jgi:hypothetical protein
VLPEHGRLLVVEEVLAAPNQPGGKVMDLLMAAVGGRERTWQERRALLRPAPAQAQTVVMTRPTPNGGTTVRSVSVTQGLKGTGLVSGVSYRAVELSGTVVNELPRPGTGTFFSTVTTLLIPRAAPRRPCWWWWWSTAADLPEMGAIPIDEGGAKTCQVVVDHNTAEGVTWVHSYVTPTGGRPSVSNDGR